MKPYIVVDLETTGLVDPSTKILQLCAIYDDGKTVPEKLPYINVLIKNVEPLTGGHYALMLNSWILKELICKSEERKTNYPIYTLQEAQEKFNNFTNDCVKLTGEDNYRFSLAGKNAGSFDIPIMNMNGFDMTKFKHRVIDPGSIFFPEFGYVPSQDEINKYLGRTSVTHNAYDDCLDVVYSIRAKF